MSTATQPARSPHRSRLAPVGDAWNRVAGLLPMWAWAIVFAYLILILVFRPQGLLGEQTREAG